MVFNEAASDRVWFDLQAAADRCRWGDWRTKKKFLGYKWIPVRGSVVMSGVAHFIRPSGTSVPDGLTVCFTADVIFLSPRVLRGPSTDRPETLPHGRNLAEFYNSTSKFGALPHPPPPKKMGPKNAKFRPILCHFTI